MTVTDQPEVRWSYAAFVSGAIIGLITKPVIDLLTGRHYLRGAPTQNLYGALVLLGMFFVVAFAGGGFVGWFLPQRYKGTFFGCWLGQMIAFTHDYWGIPVFQRGIFAMFVFIIPMAALVPNRAAQIAAGWRNAYNLRRHNRNASGARV